MSSTLKNVILLILLALYTIPSKTMESSKGLKSKLLKIKETKNHKAGSLIFQNSPHKTMKHPKGLNSKLSESRKTKIPTEESLKFHNDFHRKSTLCRTIVFWSATTITLGINIFDATYPGAIGEVGKTLSRVIGAGLVWEALYKMHQSINSLRNTLKEQRSSEKKKTP